MKIVTWNCRGLGNRPAVRGLLDLQKREGADILFLAETKMDRRRVEKFRWTLGLTNLLFKECVGKSGGLALFWRSGIDVSLRSISKYFIDVDVGDGLGGTWRFTGVYGEAQSDKKDITWRAMRILNASNTGPWLCSGDFNEILFVHEKQGGVARPQACMDKFRAALEECGMEDLGFKGDVFTWRNHSHKKDRYIRERLDRAVANAAWRSRFPLVEVLNGDPRHSDHRPVIIKLEGARAPMVRNGMEECFKFEARWLQEDGCADLVLKAWLDAFACGARDVRESLQGVSRVLLDWSRNVLGDLEKRIMKVKKELASCLTETVTDRMVHREQVLRYRLEKLEEQKDIYWKQRAHVEWLKQADRNTSFYHAYASYRRKINQIKGLKMENGEWVEEAGLREYIASQYSELFTSQGGANLAEVMDRVQPRVTPMMNESLGLPYTEEEIVDALSGIGDLKAPGPDGMPAIFFKKFWEVVGGQVKKEVMAVLNGGGIPVGWNVTTVVLIPKVNDPQNLKELRPISLCNVLYKIISKVLANRLKGFLNDIISPNQSAFVPGRLITDNVLVAYEMTHYLQNKRRGADGYLALKLDMSKAYDRVEWDFLEAMLVRLGFHNDFVQLLMECVRTVRYRIRVNGKLTEEIIPQRGLRQGDPLSPYLFLICAEGFSSLVRHAETNNMLQGIRICHNAPSVSHLLFADDSLILLKATTENAACLQNILDIYEGCSGQKINKEKSAIAFSKNTRSAQREAIKQVLQVHSESVNEKYLGLPVYISRSKRGAFQYIKDKIWRRIQGWKEKLLSKAGKEILIKAVAQAIPTFAMSCFDLTKAFCDDLSSMICRYWWSQQEKDKLHWLSWEKLLQPKRDGGLGFRDLHHFNLAMLAKQVWRLMQNPESLCGRLLRARYFPNGNILRAVAGQGASYSWRSITRGIDLINKGIIWRVGNGGNINIWDDPWLPREKTRRVNRVQGPVLLHRVSELINPISNSWDKELVRGSFLEDDAEIILAIPLRTNQEDLVAWHFDPKGKFSVKSAYKVSIDSMSVDHGPSSGIIIHCPTIPTDFAWKKIWSLSVPNKVKHFVWRLAHNSLPLRRNIQRRGMDIDTRCPMCLRFDEDAGHLFVKCKYARTVWRELLLEEQRLGLAGVFSLVDVFRELWQWEKDLQLKVVILFWVLWRVRNEVNAGEVQKMPSVSAGLVLRHFMEFSLMVKPQEKTTSIVKRWTKPSLEYVKLNTDGSFQQLSRTGGWGFIIRDHHGKVIGSGAGHIGHCSSVMQAEAMAVLQGLSYANVSGLVRVELETDAVNIRSALLSHEFDLAPVGVLFRDIKVLMFSAFLDVKVLFNPRSCNAVADKLAKLGCGFEPGSVFLWPDDYPASVSDLVATDFQLAFS